MQMKLERADLLTQSGLSLAMAMSPAASRWGQATKCIA
eukprot:SAG31_NODE_37323_length_305_cov_0.752427_1_plen_37_part_01